MINVADALYFVRCMRPEKLRGLTKAYASDIERALCAALEAAGHAPGETAADADALKLRLMGQTLPAGYGEGSAPSGRLEAVLEETAELTGSDSVWRQLERFTLFCSRMRFGKPGSGIVEDDKLLPVYAWCRAYGREPAADLAEATELYLAWTRETIRQFKASRDKPPGAGGNSARKPG